MQLLVSSAGPRLLRRPIFFIYSQKHTEMTCLIQLNNTAVCQIKRQKYLKAISTLTKGLKLSKTVLSREDEKRRESSDFTTSFRCKFRRSGTSSFLPTIQNEQGSIFKDPIHVTSPKLDEELETCELLCYAMLYNLALAHHLRASAADNNEFRTECLHNALTLYESAYHVLRNQKLQLPLFHSMAIASNLGHIHHALGNKTNAHICYQHLLSTIIFVVDSGEGEKVKHLDGFFRNVMPLIAKVSSAPAA